MSEHKRVTPEERTYLRDLAKRYMAVAAQPVMAERTKLWYDHNELKSPRPVVVFEAGPVLGEMMPKGRCTTPLAQEIESNLQAWLTDADIQDDKVLAPYYRICLQIHFREYDMDWTSEHAADAKGREIGFAMHYPVTDLARDLPTLRHSVYHADWEATRAHQASVDEILGGILPTQIENYSLVWYASPSYRVVRLMGMEAMLMAMIDQPEAMKALYRFIVDDMKRFLTWQEKEGLLTPNNANHYAGAGSYGFSRQLKPVPGQVKLRDLWLNMNSQETVGISPAMYEEFVAPSYIELSELAGLTYYGCCEPVHKIWDTCISKLHHLRKVSISPWCDEETMGEKLRQAGVIYSRKPRPNYIGVGHLDEAAFAEHIAQTVRAARGGHLEIVFRDIYALEGDADKPARAVQIVREQFEKHWA